MTTGTDRIPAIFQDARELQADALEMLASRVKTRLSVYSAQAN